jgi:septum formation protein
MGKGAHNMNRKIILASQSPRRHHLLKQIIPKFEIITNHDQAENYPEHLSGKDIPIFLANHKADAVKDHLKPGAIIITADTIVICEGRVVNKPGDLEEAKAMLQFLSGRVHEVITGVCIMAMDRRITFHSSTKVYFTELLEDEIESYIDRCKPLDKAGAYGIQEWIGYIGVEKIEGSFFNVMGLPIQRLYKELKNF